MTLWSFVSLAASPLWSQSEPCTATASGQVIDDHDETPLAYAIIEAIGTGKATIADSLAYFKLEGLCPGKHTLRVNHVGCETMTFDVVIHEKKKNEFLFRLEHHHELRELVVASRRQSVEARVNTVQLKDGELELVRMESLARALEQLEGVSTLKSGPNVSKPIVHGVFGNRVAIYNNFAKLEDQQWGSDHAPAMELSGAGSVAVVKGAQGLEYGPEAIGGAVVMLPPAFETQRRAAGSVQTGFFTNGRGVFTNAQMGGALLPGKRLRYRLSGGWNQSGDRHTPDYVLNNTGSEQGNISGAFQYQYKTLVLEASHHYTNQNFGILTDAHNGSLTDLAMIIDRGQPFTTEPFAREINNPRQHVQHHTSQFSASVKPSHHSQLDLRYAYQHNLREEYDIRRGRYNDIPAVDLRLRTHQANLIYTRVLSSNMNVKTGLEGRYIDNLSNPETGIRPIIPNYVQQQLGGFAHWNYRTNKWEIEAGARYDLITLEGFKWYRASIWENNYQEDFSDFEQYYNESGSQVFTTPAFTYHNISAALGATRNWSDDFLTGLRVAMASRPPNAPELFSDGLHLGAATVEYGNLALQTENAYTLEAFGRFQKGRVTGDISAYARYFDGYIMPEISGVELTVRGAFPRMNYIQTDALYVGMDVRMHLELHPKWTLQHSGALVYARDVQRNAPLPFLPPANMRNELVWKPVLGKNTSWLLALGVESVAQQTFAPQVVTVTELMTLSQAEIELIRQNGAFDIAAPPGEFHLLNARIQCTVPLKNRSLDFAVIAENILNRSYRNYLNRFRYFAHEEGFNLRLMLNVNF